MLEFYFARGKQKTTTTLFCVCCRFILFSLYDFKICPPESLAPKITFIGVWAHMGFVLGRRL
jgi:hypothetical protein